MTRAFQLLIAALMLAIHTLVPASVPADPVALSVRIVGNHFVNGSGQTVRLLGVNAPSTEYACEQGWAYSSQPSNAAEAAVIASWHANAVRIPLNEDCWLGINGQPSYGSVAGYRQAIASWVSVLNVAGIYAVLDLHWSAPGANVADGQRPMPDDHSAAFWASVAAAFRTDPAVVFDAFNEPYSPAANANSVHAVDWTCWRDGGCAVPIASDGSPVDDSATYVAVGMQTLVDSIRNNGATQPILLGGLSYANDLSGWLANAPVDPAGQLAASFHNYDGQTCALNCWNTTIASVATVVPVVTGEFDQGFDCTSPPTGSTFDDSYFQWADRAGVSYLAWGWWVIPDSTTACSSLPGGGSDAYALISDNAGTPVTPDGTALKDHLAALASTESASQLPPFPAFPALPAFPGQHPLSRCAVTNRRLTCQS